MPTALMGNLNASKRCLRTYNQCVARSFEPKVEGFKERPLIECERSAFVFRNIKQSALDYLALPINYFRLA